MGQVRHEIVIDGPREKVFAYIDDYRNVPEFMFGVGRFSPLTEQTSGLGSTFETAIKVGPKELTAQVKCVEWTANEIIRMESIAGFGADTCWSFADGDEPGTTLLLAEFGYTLPGGLAGKVLGGLMGPFVDQAVKHTETKVKAAIEG
ncbi:SRPBCC family protein [Gordonia alkaliphila]|uniref:SRPBCC family protein n=1 Tax=Gordonia alkaliphila TaxID=1053547 RepID=UPI001FF1586E|nr:SRPBCC family protein [Gordonia alkaliphila]MCK0438011.1 SRPBCC family protein [Gordonia alkaliphila]